MTAGCSYRKDIAYARLVSVDDGMEKLKTDRKWKWPSIVITFWIVSLILVVFVYFIDFFQMQSFRAFNKIANMANFPELADRYNTLNGYLINTPGCRIPDMNPFDPSIKKYIFKPAKYVCNKGIPPLFDSNLTSIYMMTENLPLYNAANARDISCCYTKFWRKQPVKDQTDTQTEYSNNCVLMNDSVAYINDEFIKVLCTNKKQRKVYEDYFPFVPLKKKITHTSPSSNSKPNILVLGLDSVSRVNLHRQLPDTFKYLVEELGAVELLGYNKVADNTFLNLMPVLTGMFESELKNSCWPSIKFRFDNCPFIFTNFSQNDYVTAFGEDCAWIGMFNYEKRGFLRQPTDYYYTSFDGEIESKIGEDKDFNCLRCVGGRERFNVTLKYVQKFIDRMTLESLPYFGFFWSVSLSHDYLNRPALGDGTYYNLFSSMKENGHLENTILIFMSDHGIRFGDIRQTHQGQMEERLPFVFVVLPKWFKENYPAAVKNLNKNAKRLTTPFDMHETLKDLLDLSTLKDSAKRVYNNVSRGYSLFNEIPIKRTCADAKILSHWCTCQQSIEMLTNDTKVIAAAEFAVNDINSQLKGYAQCATLVLDKIINARILYHDSRDFTANKTVMDFTVILQTVPGDGVFEVTVRYKENQFHITTRHRRRSTVDQMDQWVNFTTTGTISRLNLYGNQSYCITDFHLKLYCYCKSLLKI